MKKATIVLASGGTGGHVFPAFALAEELIKRNYNVVLVTDKRCKKFLIPTPGLEVQFVSAASFRKAILHKLIAVVKLCLGTLSALCILKQLKPTLVVGFGGYPSFPTLVAARILGLNIILHEQNSILGKVNKYFAGTAKVIATSFHDIVGILERDKSKIIFSGNPVRSQIKAISNIEYNKPAPGGELRLLVVGGSQGAAVFSKVIPEAFKLLSPEERSRIKVVQQCQDNDIEPTRQTYKQLGIEHEIASFFRDIDQKLANTHLVICRAGASTAAELAVSGRPAILIPYPYATANHQMFNAAAIVEKHAGWLMPQEIFNAINLAEQLKAFLDNPDLLIKTAEHAKQGYPDAAVKLADIVVTQVK